MQRFFLLTLLFLGAAQLFATHNRSGIIVYEQTGPLTIQATVVTYTAANALPADRDTLTISWGDNHSERVHRSNGEGQLLEGNFKRNFYTATHTYATLGEYIISMTDPNRNGGIINVNPPNSATIAFHLQTTVKLLDPETEGANRSPELLHSPTDLAYAGFPFVYNPNAMDADGDSLAFELIVPMQDINVPVPNYLFPNEVDSGIPNTFTLNEHTGEIRWEVPILVGEYNIAMLIKSFRNGKMVDAMVLDMQIVVLPESPDRIADTDPETWGIRIFPNPVQNRILRVETSRWNNPVPYVIFGIAGQKVAFGELREPIQEISLSNLSAGNYTISVQVAGRWRSKTIQLVE